MKRHWAAAGLVALGVGFATLPALAAPPTTVDRTIQDTNDDNRLEYAPGEPHTVIGAPPTFRPPRNGSLLNLLQLTDFQMIDEESPARVEFVDRTQQVPGAQPLSAAYRPQESLTTQITEAMVRNVRDAVSPVTGAPTALTVLTGDSADSQQWNETRWFIDILDGRGPIDPNTGIPNPICPGTPGSRYNGVRGGGPPGYYEPDASTGQDGEGYSPLRAQNLATTGRDVTVRDFPNLLEAANAPFQPVGLRKPWYTAFGNHDALVQGNSPDAYLGPFGPGNVTSPDAIEDSNEGYQAVATGCIKLTQQVDDTQLAAFRANPVVFALANPGLVALVPPDPRRCLIAKDEADPNSPEPCRRGGWVEQHFNTAGSPRGHGLAPGSYTGYGRPPVADANDDGYYSFRPATGFRFVVLDTVTDECGVVVCAEGSVDDAQFRWLEAQIGAAATAREYVMVFSHHTLRTTRFPSTDPTEQPVHFGQRVDRRGGQPQEPSPGVETLEDLYCRSPNLMAHIAGHEHENYVIEYKCANDTPPAMGTPPKPSGTNRFLHVSTAAHLDWPQQSRMVEVVANRDCTTSMVLTMLDHGGPPDPGGSATTGPRATANVNQLASIGRELSYNDYQGSRAARGGPADRNVIYKTDKPPPPFGKPCVPGGGGGGGGGGDDDDDDGRRDDD